MIARVILLLVDRPRIFLFDCLQTFFFKTRGQTGHFLSILFSSFSFRFRVCSVLLHPLCPDDRGVSSRGCIRCPILFLSRWAFDRWNENGITSDDSTKTILGLRCNSKWAIPFHWNECERTMKHKLISKQTIVFFFLEGGRNFKVEWTKLQFVSSSRFSVSTTNEAIFFVERGNLREIWNVKYDTIMLNSSSFFFQILYNSMCLFYNVFQDLFFFFLWGFLRTLGCIMYCEKMHSAVEEDVEKGSDQNLRPCLRSGIQISLFAEMAQLGLQGRHRWVLFSC